MAMADECGWRLDEQGGGGTMGRRKGMSWRTGKIGEGPKRIADTLFGPHKHRSGESFADHRPTFLQLHHSYSPNHVE